MPYIFYILVCDSCCSSPKSLTWLQQLMFSFNCRGTCHSFFKALLLNNTLFPKSYQELGRVLYCFLQGRGSEWEFSALLWIRRQPKMLMHNIWRGRLCPDFNVLHPVLMSCWSVPSDTKSKEKAQAAGARCAFAHWLPTFIDKNLRSLVSAGRSVKIIGVVCIFRLVCLLEKE